MITTSLHAASKQYSESALKTFKNTYALLSMTLLNTAIFAYISMEAEPLHWGIQIVGIIGLLLLTFLTKNSVLGLGSIMLFTGFLGYTMGSFINMAIDTGGAEIVVLAAGGTALALFSASLYVWTSGKDFVSIGRILFLSLTSLIVLSLANYFFFEIGALQFIISILMCLLMFGYMLYDVSQVLNGHEDNYIMATVSVYLDVIILFQHMILVMLNFKD